MSSTTSTRHRHPTVGLAAPPPESSGDWAARSACRGTDPDELFVTGAAQHRAKAVCLGCPVRTECLADALDNQVEFGVWGGMTERERRAVLKRRPTVRSWRRLLETARDEHERSLGDDDGDDADDRAVSA